MATATAAATAVPRPVMDRITQPIPATIIIITLQPSVVEEDHIISRSVILVTVVVEATATAAAVVIVVIVVVTTTMQMVQIQPAMESITARGY